MTKYRLNTTKRKPPARQTTDQYKDFARLKANYQVTLERIHKRPLYRDPKMLFALALVLLIVWLLLMEVGASEPSTAPVDSTTEQVD